MTQRNRTQKTISTAFLGLSVLLTSCKAPLPPDVETAHASLPDSIDFNFDVKPILSDRCFACHGPDAGAREADYRLDIEAAAVNTKSESGRIGIVPGRPSKSELVRRILHEEEETRMPPAESRLTLSPLEKATLVKWVEQGAEFQPHWSFIPPRAVRPPDNDTSWARGPIDRFILAGLAQTALKPSPETSKESWLRRVSLDLTGLPPSLDEIDAFLADETAGAYERVVDRLLASDHFGERLAVDWLDAARYADTHGYQDDGYRFVWPWRDWVVKAFNENMPYDRFLTWQLAGDLLPGATREQRLATTFLRNHRINSEAGIVGEEYRVEYVADRLHTVGSAVMGLTVECARCHDHKYDPISQQEYYSLFAYFNNVRELGEIANEGNPGPLMPLMSKDTEARLHALADDIERAAHRVDALRESRVGSLPDVTPADIERRLRKGLVSRLSFERIEGGVTPDKAGPPARLGGAPSLDAGVEGRGIRMTEYDVVRLGDETGVERTEPFSASIWVRPAADTGYVPIWGNPGNKNEDFRGYELFLSGRRPVIRLCHAVPHNYLEVAASVELVPMAWTHLVVTYDGSSRAEGVRLFVNGREAPLEAGWDRLYKSVKKGGLRLGGANARGGFSEGMLDEFRFYNRPLLEAEAAWLYDGAVEVIPDEDRLALVLEADPEYTAALDTLRTLRRLESAMRDTIPEIMVMEEMASPRPAYVLRRGVYDARGEVVPPGTPAAFNPMPAGASPDRLGLAQWMTSSDHPLTARVAVNRFWRMLFGRGIVATPGDWGNQGALPAHPELLDWLAVRFVESGWDVKALFREIVLSSVYRQSSVVSPEHLEVDPDNVLLARGPAFRLSAEMIRDQALAASGLLVRRIGGPPVKPYQPEGLWEELAAIQNSISTYKQDRGEGLYRRSLYTFWKRSAPPPSLATFDAPTREVCQVQRASTSTPLQALVLWNDPQFVEAARVLAERAMLERASVSDRIRMAFRLLTGRPPSGQESSTLEALFEDQYGRFSTAPERAESLLETGDSRRNVALDAVEAAAFTSVVQAIMSYDASVMRR